MATAKASKFAFKQAALRTVALEIDVVYKSRLTRIAIIGTGDECRFEEASQVEYWQTLPRLADGRIDSEELQKQNEERANAPQVIHEPIRLDPYAVMEAFECVQSQEELLSYLNEAGMFWSLGSLTWTQFLEWQRFVQCVRDPNFPENCLMDKYAAEALSAVNGFPNTCFPASAWKDDWVTRRERERAAERGEADPFAFSKKFHEEEIRRQAMCFRKPSPKMFENHFLVPKKMLPTDAEMRERAEPHTSMSGKQRVQQTEKKLQTLSKLNWFAESYIAEYGLKPAIVVRAGWILDAIAAAIWANRYSGIKYARCEGCQRLFNKESEHGRKYCSGTCKNVVTQREWRKRKRDEKLELCQKPNSTKRNKRIKAASAEPGRSERRAK